MSYSGKRLHWAFGKIHGHGVILDREIAYTETPFGKIKVKQALKKGKIIREIPEYEDVKKAALKHDVPFYDVYHAALRSAAERH